MNFPGITDHTFLNFLLWSTAFQFSFYIYNRSEHTLGLSIWLLPIALYGWIGFKYQDKHARYVVLSILGYCMMKLIPMIWSLPSSMKLLAFFTIGLTFMGLGWLYNKKQVELVESTSEQDDHTDL